MSSTTNKMILGDRRAVFEATDWIAPCGWVAPAACAQPRMTIPSKNIADFIFVVLPCERHP
ncbi:MAG: hypothetical protein QNL65_10935 [Opitutales bacterium]